MIEEKVIDTLFQKSEELLLLLHFGSSKRDFEYLLQLSKVFANLSIDEKTKVLFANHFAENSLIGKLRENDVEFLIENTQQKRVPLFVSFLLNVSEFLIPRVLSKEREKKDQEIEAAILLRCYRIFKNLKRLLTPLMFLILILFTTLIFSYSLFYIRSHSQGNVGHEFE